MPAQSSDLLIVQRGATLYSATAQEIANLASGGGGSVYAAMILQNTDTSTDLSLTSYTVVPIGGTATSIGAGFTQIGNTIRADFDGAVRLSASIYLYSSYARAAVALEFFKNGTSLGPRYNTSYIRATSGHNQASSACPAFVTTCSNGDVFDLRAQKDGASAVATMNGVGASYLMAERVL